VRKAAVKVVASSGSAKAFICDLIVREGSFPRLKDLSVYIWHFPVSDSDSQKFVSPNKRFYVFPDLATCKNVFNQNWHLQTCISVAQFAQNGFLRQQHSERILIPLPLRDLRPFILGAEIGAHNSRQHIIEIVQKKQWPTPVVCHTVQLLDPKLLLFRPFLALCS
jgi:hypothetical protein